MADQYSKFPILPATLAARVDALPPMLSVVQLAEFFEKKVGTIRKQIERRVFPIRIRQFEGGEQYATLTDLISWLVDGEPQPQPPLVRRASHNPYGRKGKVGRKTNAQKTAEARAIQQSGVEQ